MMNAIKKLSEIWIYPVKSLGGISLKKSGVLPKGLPFDRRWMLVDSNNRFLTQRNFPRLALFRVKQNGNGFQIEYAGRTIDLTDQCEGPVSDAVIWNSIVEVQEVSARHSQWFSEGLGISCNLVFFPEKNLRPVDPLYAVRQDQVSLADGYPVLLAGESSLADLNSRMIQPVPMNRFRPNLVFSGGEPFEEDRWRTCRIGTSRFAVVKPCDRCVIITVDQEKGEKGTEPLATLALFRKKDNGIYFGQNLIPTDCKEISVGDEIIIE